MTLQSIICATKRRDLSEIETDVKHSVKLDTEVLLAIFAIKIQYQNRTNAIRMIHVYLRLLAISLHTINMSTQRLEITSNPKSSMFEVT